MEFLVHTVSSNTSLARQQQAKSQPSQAKAKPSQVKSSQVKSSQIKSSQVKSSQANDAGFRRQLKRTALPPNRHMWFPSSFRCEITPVEGANGPARVPALKQGRDRMHADAHGGDDK